MSQTQALRTFFDAGRHGRKVTVAKMKALSLADREDLATLAAVELAA